MVYTQTLIPDVLSQRLSNQKLSLPDFKKPVAVVRWLGAVQAQDYNAAKWALALRMSRATDAVVEQAYNEGKILRTHLMRPTWHFVAPEDIRWLLQLTAARVNVKCCPNYRKLGLDDAIFKRSNKALANVLKGGKHLTRAVLRNVLNESGVAADDSIRLAHIFLRAELDGVVCSGRRIGRQFTYALLEERVPATKTLTSEEALAKLTRCYFTSHGPATLQDFIWWSGLTAVDARHGIELIDRHLKEEKTYWSARSTQLVPRPLHSAHLLPAYDEYTVAYKDRQTLVDGKPSIDPQCLLGPIVIVAGKFAGTWKAANNKKSVTITLNLSRVLKKSETTALAQAANRYAGFLGLSPQVYMVDHKSTMR